jgi:hypothetical protein
MTDAEVTLCATARMVPAGGSRKIATAASAL